MPRAITSRADLLRCAGKGIGLAEAAGVLGFRGRISETPSRQDVAWKDQSSASVSGTDTTPEQAPKFVFPSERPRLTFLRAVTAETFKSEIVRQKVGNPISDAQLAVDWSKSGPALPQLTRWARLSPFLHQRLGCSVPGLRLNERKLMKEVGKGLPLVALPRRLQRVWAPQAVVLWDFTPEMFPFAKDVRWLVRRLQRERGNHGLDVRLVRSLPSRRHVSGIPTITPVLALSSMGQYESSPSVGAAWVALGRKLTHWGHRITALMPCPRDSWDSQLANVWPSAVWDRRPRLPRHGGLRPRSGKGVSGEMVVEQLLDFLSPASRIESPLVRTARLKLGPVANVGTEWRAWHHPDLWSSLDSCGFIAGENYEQRLERRRSLTGQDAELAREIGGLMEAHHEQCSVVIAAEARLRACLTGGMETSTLEQVKSLLAQVVDRLRQMAPEPGTGEGKDSGLAPWFIGMVNRLDDQIRKEPEVAELITNGLAYAHSFEETDHVILPGGIEPEAFAKATREVAKHIQPRDYRIELRAENEWQANLGLAAGKGLGAVPRPPLEPLRSSLLVSSRPLQFQHGEKTHRLELGGSSGKPLATLAGADGFTLESDVQKITFQPTKRPAWARRMWYDRYGLAAEFFVGMVPFVMRWIPPGRFMMGSPEDEPGRYDDEGPVHEVTISKGFWLGETPVTQAQWRAVVEPKTMAMMDAKIFWTKFGKQDLKPDPSEFKRSPELPVENVNWLECRDFCGLLTALMQTPYLQFHLPSEAQWEYACRAGTETAIYTGGITIPANNYMNLREKLKIILPQLLPANPAESMKSTELIRLVKLRLKQEYSDALLRYHFSIMCYDPASPIAKVEKGEGYYVRTAKPAHAGNRAQLTPFPARLGPVSENQPEGENNAPELHNIAWYGGNSGLELEVFNPQHSQGWPRKQFDQQQAGTHRVKLKQANPWGLYDMIGNVWEWCADEWHEDAYKKRADGVTDSRHDSADDSSDRVIRGGSWGGLARGCRSACRDGSLPDFRWGDLGLRLAAGQELDGEAAGRGAPPAGESQRSGDSQPEAARRASEARQTKPSPEGRRQSRAAGENFPKKRKQ